MSNRIEYLGYTNYPLKFKGLSTRLFFSKINVDPYAK